jgi:hypothetical protein
MIFAADAQYHARLGQKLRDAGFDIELDQKTGAARMTAIPRDVAALFSKRSVVGEQWARIEATPEGLSWDDLIAEQKETRIKRYTRDKVKQRRAAEKDDVADFNSWQSQAKGFGWDVPTSLIGSPTPELTHEQQIRHAYEVALPFLAEQFANRAVLTHWDLQVAAARGLVATGSRDVGADVLAVTKMMRTEGVKQYGEKTPLVWGAEPGKRHVSVTTGLHENRHSAHHQRADECRCAADR